MFCLVINCVVDVDDDDVDNILIMKNKNIYIALELFVLCLPFNIVRRLS